MEQKSFKVRVKVEHTLFCLQSRPLDDLRPGPTARQGQLLDVIGMTNVVLNHKRFPYYLVKVDGVQYTAWPPHTEVAT